MRAMPREHGRTTLREHLLHERSLIRLRILKTEAHITRTEFPSSQASVPSCSPSPHVVAGGASGGGGGGAQVLDDLLDVTIGGAGTFDLNGNPVQQIALQDGQILQYNSGIGQWVNRDVALGAHTGETPPANAQDGTLWWDSSNSAGGGRLYISYTDDGAEGNGASTQWVPATPDAYGTGTGGGGSGGATRLNELLDVNANPGATGDFLTWDDLTSSWVATSTIDGGTF